MKPHYFIHKDIIIKFYSPNKFRKMYRILIFIIMKKKRLKGNKGNL